MSQLIDKLKKLGASSLEIEAIIYSDDINKSLSEFYKKSLEIAFEEKDQTTFLPCSSSVNPRKGHLEKAQSPIAYSQCSFSERKDTLKKSLEQHLMRAFLNKKDNILR